MITDMQFFMIDNAVWVLVFLVVVIILLAQLSESNSRGAVRDMTRVVLLSVLGGYCFLFFNHEFPDLKISDIHFRMTDGYFVYVEIMGIDTGVRNLDNTLKENKVIQTVKIKCETKTGKIGSRECWGKVTSMNKTELLTYIELNNQQVIAEK